MLADKQFREAVVEKITDPLVKAFWTQEFAKYTDRLASEATASVQNKVGQFTSSSLIRNILGQVHSTLDVRKVMDEKKILIMNLSRGKIGEDVSRLLGAMMITKIQLAAMSRADILEKEITAFYLYVDEFQHFATDSFANILSEARKFALNLTIAHQYITQMEETVRDAVFGNVGTIVSFRVGAEDAEVLEKEFAPAFTANDLVNLAKWQIYLKLMIDGVASSAFSANTLPPWPGPEISYKDEIIKYSRETYARPREEVEKKINEWSAAIIESTARKRTYESSQPSYSPNFQFQSRPNTQRTERFNSERFLETARQKASGNAGSEKAKAGDKTISYFPKLKTEIDRPRADVDASLRRSPKTGLAVKDQVNVGSGTNNVGAGTLSEALKSGPVDFRGRKILSKPVKREKVSVDLDGLKQTLSV